MHILKGQSRGLDAAAEPVDLEQTPGDIVVLSAADTELAALATTCAGYADFPCTLRVANWMALGHPYSVDLYGEKVLSGARLIVIRLLGGSNYWRYGLDEAKRVSRANRIRLAVLPGDATWDPVLAAEGNIPEPEARRLWSYLVEGGSHNIRHFLDFTAYLLGEGKCPPEAEPLPTAGIYRNPAPGLDGPGAAIIFYRALLQSGQTAPVDALCDALEASGSPTRAIYVNSLKSNDDSAVVRSLFAERDPSLILNATSFALSKPGEAFAGTVLDDRRRPVLQVTFAGTSGAAWSDSTRGLSPSDLTMNVVLPEIDGRIVTRAVSFKESETYDPITQSRPARHKPRPDRVEFVAELARNWMRLGEVPAAGKRVAILLSNYPNRDGRLANGVGLDAPESTARLLACLASEGYDLPGAPRSGEALMAHLLAGPTNARSARRHDGEAFPLAEYRRLFNALPNAVQNSMRQRWGEAEDDPFVADGTFVLPAHRFGNVVIGIQPARGYNIDPKATYHDPDLVPPHGYLAFYMWLRESFGAQAIVHMGKHGNLEWLPGKALALSAGCYPEAVLGPVPVIYPFIVNDPGEGAQAKRRSSAVVVDHLMPPMARAESYGAAAEIEALIDEYAAAEAADPRRAGLVARQIIELSQTHGFDRDLGLDGADRDAMLARLDEHICDLKELQIRDGLHILGTSPGADQRTETIVRLAHVTLVNARMGVESLARAIAGDLGLAFDPLDCRMAEAWTGPRPECLAAISDAPWRIVGDSVERIELLSQRLVAALVPAGDGASRPAGDPTSGGTGTEAPGPRSATVLDWLRRQVAPALDCSGERELQAIVDALAGRFVEPGPSGAPTRGRADCLPTGRNFYSVDVRAVPTPAAWELGRRSADLLGERYFQEEGEWPKAMALTVWGTSNMRTGGDDIAQALALIGARPVWQGASGRVTGIEIVPLSELGRPRIDVTLRISGLFRDAFPTQIALFHEAVQAVSERDEPDDANPIAARIRADAAALEAGGLTADAARRAASFRVFGSKPGAYGAGLQALIDEGIWSERKDLAAAFMEWSAYAYGGGAEGEGARGLLETRLKTIDAVVQNQDNREHDILDSDDYYQFEGGLAASVESLAGRAPRIFHNDHSRPERPVIRTLDEEIARVVRGRAANPKWIRGVMRHGYKGAFEIAATIDYLFAFAATTNAVRHHHFEQLYDAYIADEAVRGFIAEANAPALKEIAARFCEAIDRGLWAPRLNSAYDDLRRLAGRAA